MSNRLVNVVRRRTGMDESSLVSVWQASTEKSTKVELGRIMGLVEDLGKELEARPIIRKINGGVQFDFKKDRIVVRGIRFEDVRTAYN